MAVNPQVVKKLTLFSIFPLPNLFQEFDFGWIANPSSKMALQSMWTSANQAYALIGPPSRSFLTQADVQPLQGVAPQKIADMLARMRCYPPFDSHPVGIYDVNISKLVTPQITINMTRAARRANISQSMTNDQLFDLAFNSGGQFAPITRQVVALAPNGGALMFTSYDEDVRLYHPPMDVSLPSNLSDPQGTALESTCFPIGGGTPFAWAMRVRVDASNTRLILCNAIHRMYSLAAAGYTHCPLAVCDHLVSEVPDVFVQLTRDSLVNPSQNPPLITDYLNTNVTIPLDYYLVLRTVRLNWQFETYSTVLK